MPRCQFTVDEQRRMVAMRERGQSFREIAERVGATLRQVQHIVYTRAPDMPRRRYVRRSPGAAQNGGVTGSDGDGASTRVPVGVCARIEKQVWRRYVSLRLGLMGHAAAVAKIAEEEGLLAGYVGEIVRERR